ncbi:MAG: hypothetical protein FJ303_14290 [Planctomycetes bacterium]|nr:hypothetical protein [Planctomycetota bacterium]
MQDVAALPTLNDLRQYVLDALCRHDNLDPTQTPIVLSIITRHGKPCGIFFQVQGPRLLKNYAIWAGEENRILYYNCNGERIAETKLSEAPDPHSLPLARAA